MDIRNVPSGATVITKSDTTQLYLMGLYVGGAGNVQVDTGRGDKAVLFSNIPAGSIIPLVITKVYSTNTSATNMVGFIGSFAG